MIMGTVKTVMPMEIYVVKIENRKIVLDTSAGVVEGTIMEQLERLLAPLGYYKINQSMIANLKPAKRNGDVLEIGSNEYQISRRNISNVIANFDKIQH